jgi:hypothetical protein
MIQPNNDGRRGKWLAKIQDYDLEVKPSKMVKGQGLEKLLSKSNFRALGINHFESHNSLPNIEESDDQTPTIQIDDKFSSSSWYNNIILYLLTLQCLIRIWTRGQKFAQNSKCSECNENGAIASVSSPDSGGIFTFANGVRMEKLSRSVRRAKQAKI